MKDGSDWIPQHGNFWEEQLDSLAYYLNQIRQDQSDDKTYDDPV